VALFLAEQKEVDGWETERRSMMGRLLEDMTRLSEEIDALRGNRQEFRRELVEGNKGRQMDVFELCMDFSDTQARAAKRGKETRLATLKILKRAVHGRQREMRADIAAARRAWVGRDE
jgi:hypothetical protein